MDQTSMNDMIECSRSPLTCTLNDGDRSPIIAQADEIVVPGMPSISCEPSSSADDDRQNEACLNVPIAATDSLPVQIAEHEARLCLGVDEGTSTAAESLNDSVEIIDQATVAAVGSDVFTDDESMLDSTSREPPIDSVELEATCQQLYKLGFAPLHPGLPEACSLNVRHRSSFSIDGVSYNSVEQYILRQMCSEWDLPFNIHTAPAAARKRLNEALASGEISAGDYATWCNTNLARLLNDAYAAKLHESEASRQCLLNTGGAYIAYIDSNDDQLGTHMNITEFVTWVRENAYTAEHLHVWLYHPAIKPDEFGANTVGKVLMELREPLRRTLVSSLTTGGDASAAMDMQSGRDDSSSLAGTQDVTMVGAHDAYAMPGVSAEYANDQHNDNGDYDDGDEVPLFAQCGADCHMGVQNIFAVNSPLNEACPISVYVDDVFYPSVLHYVLCQTLREAGMRAGITKSYLITWTQGMLTEGAHDLKVLRRLYRSNMNHLKKRQSKIMQRFYESAYTELVRKFLTQGFHARLRQDAEFPHLLAASGDNFLVSATAHDLTMGIGVSWRDLVSFLNDETSGITVETLREWRKEPRHCHAFNMGLNLTGCVLMDLRADLDASKYQRPDPLVVEADGMDVSVEHKQLERSVEDADVSGGDDDGWEHIRQALGSVPFSGYLFCYKLDPFSDFYEAPFVVDDHRFPCIIEYQWTRLLQHFGLYTDKFRAIDKPAKFFFEAKRLLDKAQKSDFLNDEQVQMWFQYNLLPELITANREKYAQNPQLKQALLNTERKVLVFNHPNNSSTGVGMEAHEFNEWVSSEALSEKDVMHMWLHPELRPRELGANCFGLAVMVVREEMRSEFLLPFEVVPPPAEELPMTEVAESSVDALDAFKSKLAEHSVRVETAAPVESSLQLNVNKKLRKITVQKKKTILPGGSPSKSPLGGTEQKPSTQEVTAVVNKAERKIVIQRKAKQNAEMPLQQVQNRVLETSRATAEPKIEGSEKLPQDSAAPDIAPTEESVDPQTKRLNALERLKSLKFESKGKVNPLSIGFKATASTDGSKLYKNHTGGAKRPLQHATSPVVRDNDWVKNLEIKDEDLEKMSLPEVKNVLAILLRQKEQYATQFADQEAQLKRLQADIERERLPVVATLGASEEADTPAKCAHSAVMQRAQLRKQSDRDDAVEKFKERDALIVEKSQRYIAGMCAGFEDRNHRLQVLRQTLEATELSAAVQVNTGLSPQQKANSGMLGPDQSGLLYLEAFRN